MDFTGQKRRERGYSGARLELIKKAASLSLEEYTVSEIAIQLKISDSKVRRSLAASEGLPLLVSRFDSILGCPSFFWEPALVAAIGDAVVRDAASSAIANNLLSFQSNDWTALALLSSADAILATIDDNCLSGDKCRIIAETGNPLLNFPFWS